MPFTVNICRLLYSSHFTWTPLFLDRTMDYTVSWHSLSIVGPCVIKPHTSFSLKSFFVVNYIK